MKVERKGKGTGRKKNKNKNKNKLPYEGNQQQDNKVPNIVQNNFEKIANYSHFQQIFYIYIMNRKLNIGMQQIKKKHW